MEMIQDASLQAYNTFGIKAKASRLWKVNSSEDLANLYNKGVFKGKHLVIGGGSNLLITKDFDGDVILIQNEGIDVINESDLRVEIRFEAGEMWHQCVLWAIDNGFGGIENLSLIPGTIGAAPMQNIGAYGVEVKDVFSSLTALNKATGTIESFKKEDCAFGYRESVFKNTLKDQYIITSVSLILTKKEHRINTSYGAIQAVLDDKKIEQPTIKDVSDAVIEIRQSKLPDPKEIGNSGSFFKNPIVNDELVNEIKKVYPNMPSYDAGNGKKKLAAGWLIEQCGWKGKRVGETGSHAKQALVLVNYGNAMGAEVFELAMAIKASVKDKFGVDISPEVNVI